MSFRAPSLVIDPNLSCIHSRAKKVIFLKERREERQGGKRKEGKENNFPLAWFAGNKGLFSPCP